MKKTYITPSASVYNMTVNANLLLSASTGGVHTPGNGGNYTGQDGVSVGTKEDNDWDIW